MRKFLIKVLIFVVPFSFLFAITSLFYNDKLSPDLLRIGYIPDIHLTSFRIHSFSKVERFEKLSQAQKKSYKVLIIGDSFSHLDKGIGYNNFLADYYSVLNLDRSLTNNPVQTLVNLTNGDFFDNYDIEYVILQSVERNFVKRVSSLDLNSKATLQDLKSLFRSTKEETKTPEYSLFSRLTIEFPLYHLPRYFFSDNYISNNQVYNVETKTNSLFSNNTSKLLFFSKDIENIKHNNTHENAEKLNDILNNISKKLNEKQIKLIVLPAADKYNIYYEFITKKDNFIKPVFFKNMNKLSKDYIYIDSDQLLKNHLLANKDLYFFGDSHWSPVGAKIVADKIKEIIELTDLK